MGAVSLFIVKWCTAIRGSSPGRRYFDLESITLSIIPFHLQIG